MKKLIVMSGVTAAQVREALADPYWPKKDGRPVIAAAYNVKVIACEDKKPA